MLHVVRSNEVKLMQLKIGRECKWKKNLAIFNYIYLPSDKTVLPLGTDPKGIPPTI